MKSFVMFAMVWLSTLATFGQTAMINVSGRNRTSLNGDWQIMPDPNGSGDWRQVWLEKKPSNKYEFYEYSFDHGPTLHVPGDFNTQIPELMYYEGIVWYKTTFTYSLSPDKRLFVHFGAANYKADVYLNGNWLGGHEGGFTPFQFELTGHLISGQNALVIKVNSERQKDGIPGMGYDWFNYGGITRDVDLVETGKTFIDDYFIQLKKGSQNEVLGWLKLDQPIPGMKICLNIPELKIHQNLVTGNDGLAALDFSAKFTLWSPENPKLYNVEIITESDTIKDQIGFRQVETKGTEIRLNGKKIFLKGVNIHEERPFVQGRAYTEADATTLLNWAKELGCNMVRLSHYPHNEYMVKLAAKMGLLVWDEIPVYQHMEFSAPGFPAKMELMMQEMIRRDRNRCAVIVWSLSNETYTDTPQRTEVLMGATHKCRSIDSTRLITSVLSNQLYQHNSFTVWDTLCKYLDIICINEYVGWYIPWQGPPNDVKWNLVADKPLIITEFGGEAKYGSKGEPADAASSWSEEYQEQIYSKQIDLFNHTKGLAGVCPWLLTDYRSPVRMHPVYQKGFNRKGLLTEYGEKKKAWFIMKTYYTNSNKHE